MRWHRRLLSSCCPLPSHFLQALKGLGVLMKWSGWSRHSFDNKTVFRTSSEILFLCVRKGGHPDGNGRSNGLASLGGVWQAVAHHLGSCSLMRNTLQLHPMIKSFRHKGLWRFFETGSKSGIQAAHATKLRLQLAALDQAVKPEDLSAPSWALHPLKGMALTLAVRHPATRVSA